MCEALKNYGLKNIGNWIKSEGKKIYTAKKLKEYWPELYDGKNSPWEVNFSFHQEFSEWGSKKNVVYVFTMDDNIFYVGQTRQILKARLSNYRRGADLLKDTDNKLKVFVTKAIYESNKEISIWSIQPIADLTVGNQILKIAVHEGLERHLIEKFQPTLNSHI